MGVLRLDHDDHLPGRVPRRQSVVCTQRSGAGSCQYLEVVVTDAQLRAAADREPKQAARGSGAWVSLDEIALVEHVIQRLVDVVVIDEHDGLPFRHRHLHAVHLAEQFCSEEQAPECGGVQAFLILVRSSISL